MEERSMVEIRGFNSFDEMYEYMQANRKKANEGLAAAQRLIDYGDYWVRFWQQVVIFGYIDPLEKVRDDEVAAGADLGEAEVFVTMVMEAHNDGSMWGTAYSTIEPDGELGYTHRISMWPIDKRLFDAARQVGWVIEDLPEWAQVLLQEAARAWRSHVREATRDGA